MKANIMLENPLKVAIIGYMAAMAIVSSADAQTQHDNSVTVNMPVQCYPGLDIVKGYKAEGIFEPLFYAKDDDPVASVGFVDPSDGELHLWALVDGTPCLLDKTTLRAWNVEVLTPKGKL